MALLVRVLMLEFQAADDTQRRGRATPGPALPEPRSKVPASARREIQLELFGLLTEIQSLRRAEG